MPNVRRAISSVIEGIEATLAPARLADDLAWVQDSDAVTGKTTTSAAIMVSAAEVGGSVPLRSATGISQ
jgi:hypothetical protein